ncbi:MAG: VCBS repeat-containing protein [Verrucomicrobia bacterium]|nr:VCBS repeat-containing protein [Verrucomicrobiota bacterium]
MWALGLVTVLAWCGNGLCADKSGVSPNTISLPKGPGSIEGLGDSFQPSLNTGTAKYSLGIKLPPGTAGHQPSVSISYDGGGANGPLGYGWSLSLPFVQRRTDKGIPTYGESLGVDRSDTFIADSREELVPTADGFFFSENEGSFLRYRRVGSNWEATAPDGTRLEFGVTAAGRIGDIDNPQRVFRWLLERETDTRGNVIEYRYRSFPGAQNLNQKYLSEIRYGPGAPPWNAFHLVLFEYEDRPDWFEDGRAGFLIRTGKRLKQIHVATQGAALTNHLAGDRNGDGTNDYLNRRYEFDYLRYDGDASHWSLMSKMTLFGADGVTALPSATFDYAVSHPVAEIDASSSVWGSSNAPIAVMDNALVDLVDMNADGLPDLLKTESGRGGHSVAVNRGTSRHGGLPVIEWATPEPVEPGSGTAWNFDLASQRTHLADMDGDGLADLVHKSADDAVFFFANRGRLSWGERRDMSTQESAPPAPFGNAGVSTADLDFDKRIDIVQSVDFGGSVGYRVWFNLGAQSYSAPVTVEPEGGFDLALPGVQIADCNGDRVPDVARIQPGAVSVAAGLGYGRFGSPISLVLPDLTLDADQIAKAKLTDINGDGLADLVLERASPGTCWYWLNLGNYTLGARRVIRGLPIVASGAAVRCADLNGNGTTDLVYADATAEARLQMVELGQLLSGGLAPNLLKRIGNGIGRVTTIEYASSTEFALADEKAGRPWPDPVPFPVTVVAAVRVSDSLGHEYVTRYSYHDGYYDSVEKQFRGFAKVEEVEQGDETAPTLVSRSSFDTGRAFDAMKGRLLSSTSETEAGEIFSRETTTWANPPRLIRTGTNGQVIRFAHPVATTREILERGVGTPRRLESEVEFDGYGNRTRSSDFGIVVGGDRSAFDDERVTVTEYALNLAKWIVHLPRRTLVQDENGVVISKAEIFYDDETFSGNNLGNVTVGNLTMRREWTDPGNAAAFVNTVRTKYDSWGNPVFILDPLANAGAGIAQGHVRELAFDPVFRAHAERETIHLGGTNVPLVFSASYDAGLALMTRSVDFNGHATVFGHDVLGRPVSVIKPGDAPAYPSAEYEYALAIPTVYTRSGGVSVTGMVNYVETRGLDRDPGNPGSRREHYFIKRQFSDGLGRALMTRTEAEPAAGGSAARVSVTGAVLFNARQKPSRSLNAFFAAKTGSLDELLAYESVESAGWSGQFHVLGNLVSRDLASAPQARVEYDATLREIRSTNPDGTFRRTEFEPLMIRLFDENDTGAGSPHVDTPTVQMVDGLGRLIQVDEMVRLNDDGTPAGGLRTWSSRYRYDLNDRLTRIIDAQNNVKEFRYDGMRRKVWMNDADAGISHCRYDEASNLIELIDAKGQRTTYTHDGANRILTEDYHDETTAEFSYQRSPDVIYHYDEASGLLETGDGNSAVARNTRGTLAWVEDSSGGEHSSFDERGRMEWSVKRILDPVLSPDLMFSPATAVSYRTAYVYDSLDRITKMIFPDNDEVNYRFNARNLIEGIHGEAGGEIVAGASYLPSLQQEQVVFGNGVRTRYNYDERQRVSRLLTSDTARGAELVHFAYELDPVSNVSAMRDERPFSAIAAGDRRRNSQRFSYDALYRLTRVQYNLPNPPSSNGGEINFRYDRVGNMQAQTSDIAQLERGLPVTDVGTMSFGGTRGASERIGRGAADPAGPHALTGIVNTNGTRAFAYDSNGNITTNDGLKCQWDFRDRLVSVEDDSMKADYRYDFTGRRVLKRVLWKSGELREAQLVGTSKASRPESTFTLYPGRHFEVRDHDLPVKYVFNSGTRVAQITGSIEHHRRVQRIRFHAGWNLVSIAINAERFWEQLESVDGRAGVVLSVHRWNQTTRAYESVPRNASVSAGGVFWIRATTNFVASVEGEFVEAATRVVPAGGGYVAGPGMVPWAIELPSLASGWMFDPARRRWEAGLRGEIGMASELPAFVAPGQAIYIASDAPVTLDPFPASRRILLYHADHLGSATVITDADGAVVEESSYHPFGALRHESRASDVEAYYGFTQKERDRESGLHYFESRFLAANLGRFSSVDPKFLHVDLLEKSEQTAFLSNPQKGNLYSYVLNNPLRYSDPLGLDETESLGTMSDVVGLVAGGAEELDVWRYTMSGGGKTLASGAGKVTMGVSLAIKGGQFLMDPSAATGGQALNEGAKSAMSIAIPPVGIIWSLLDLTGYGPSAILEHTEKSIQANRAAAAHYKQAAASWNQTAAIYRDGANRLAPKLAEQQKRVDELVKKTNKYIADREREMKSINAAIEKEESELRRANRELRYWQQRERRAKAAAKSE